MLLEQTKALFAIARGECQEVVISGASVFKQQGQPSSDRSGELSVYARSLLKPWQFLVADTFGKERYWTIGLASHAGEARHLAVLNELMKAQELAVDDLRCPHAYPSNVQAAAKLLVDHRKKERIFHSCSGKHLVFLAACRRRKWDKEYLLLEHPLQQEVPKLIEKKVGRKLTWAVDGCGLVTPNFKIHEQMQLWEDFALASDEKTALLRTLWTENPDLVGGEGRLDTELVKAGRGRLLAKEGADGLLIVQTLPAKSEKVQSCFVKISSGYHPSHMGLALWSKLTANQNYLNDTFLSILNFLDTKKEDWVPADQRLQLLTSST